MRQICLWCCLLVLCLLLPQKAHAQAGDGSVRWMTMQTPHFSIYYPRGLYRFALRVANLSEEAHTALTAYTHHTPSRRTHVILLNTSDEANGAATALPRNTMYLYTAPPDSRGTLHDSDDWLRGLIYHEYLHVLHLDTMSQMFRMVNLFLGKIFAPNMTMPRWWIEGWATYVETVFTGGGRGRSSLFDAYMRAAVLTGKSLRLSQVSHATNHFPRGTAPYLYGSRFLTYVARKYGKKKLTKIAYEYGEALFPYGMNLTSKKVLKKSYRRLWKEWLAHLKKTYEAQARRIKKYPLTKVRVLTKGGEWLGVPRYLPNNRDILVYRVGGSSLDRLTLINRQTKRAKMILRTNAFALFGLDRSGKVGVVSQTEVTRNINYYYDLFRFSPRGGGLVRLTHGERAKEPDVSPDGKHVVYVRHRAGRTELRLLALATKRSTLLYRPPSRVFLSSPRFSPDGRWLVCSAWFPGGNRDLLLLRRGGTRVIRLTNDRAQNIEPVFSPDGKEILFASDRNGIFNVYALRRSDRRVRRLTNELYGAFAPAVSPDGKHLAFARFGIKGLDLVEMPFSRAERPYPMPVYRKTWPKMRYKTPRQIYPVRPYAPWNTLAPITWLPVLGLDHIGQTVGLRLNGQDILGFHTYDASLSVGLESLEVSYSLSYRYTQLWPSFTLNHGRYPRTTYGVLKVNGVDAPFSERVTYGSATVELPLASWQSSHFFFLRYEFQYLEAISLDVPLHPADVPPVLPELGLVTQLVFGWSFSNATRFGKSFGSELGRRLYLQVSLQHPALGSIGESWSVQGGWAEFVPLPWGKHHTLALNMVGAIGRSSFRGRQLFFLGGIPPQDLFQAALSGAGIGPGQLRGYPPFRFSGDAQLLLQAEYRLPLVDVEKGLGVAPAFFRRMFVAFFTDVGQVFREPYAWGQFGGAKVGVGVELRMEALIGYYLGMNVRIGFAKGLMEGGFDHLYVILGSSF